jgi:hypothetical protein
MANTVGAACMAGMAVVAHCLCIGGMLGAMLSRAVGLARRRAGSGQSVSADGTPFVGQQLFDPAVQVGGQPGEHVLQILPRLVAIWLGRLQQAHHHRSPLARQWAADEQPVASPQSPRPDPVLDMVVVIGTSPSSKYRPSPTQWFKL